MNYAANEDDIINGTQLANLKNVKIISPKFRYSNDNYSCDGKNKTIYKGTSSIKGLSKTVGSKLYELRNNTYNTFYDLLIDCEENKIGISDITTLAKLDYFSEFGNIKKILDFIDIYTELKGKKMIKKEKEYKVKQLFLKQYCSKETEKQMTGFDSEKCLKDLWNKLENSDISIKDKMKYQLQYFRYVDIIDTNSDRNHWMIISQELRGKNYIVDLYRPFNGEKLQVKVRNKVFSANPINEGDMVLIYNFDKEGKWSLNSETNEWQKSSTTFETILNHYELV